MKKVYYHKLIRDKVPEKIRRRGGDLEVYRLTNTEFEEELLKKVSEEADAVSRVTKRSDLLDELADLETVLAALKKFKKISPKELRTIGKDNMRRKGGFKKRLYLVWSSDTGYKTNERKGRPRSEARSRSGPRRLRAETH